MFSLYVLIPLLFKTPILMIYGLIPPPKHTAILLLWFSQHDAGFRFDEHRIFKDMSIHCMSL